jgi:hypothetical protein
MQWDEIRRIIKSIPVVLMEVRNVDMKERTFIETSERMIGSKSGLEFSACLEPNVSRWRFIWHTGTSENRNNDNRN